MKEPGLLDDLREVKENWHDKEFRKGFLFAFVPRMLLSILAGFVGAVVAILFR
ncbi:hypothetical protein [Caulobacter radicis]|uniref:hypothetical protein n=1 Tax=Caulobacter radicis TaxID=2172650 RepID=UPI001401D218|nr:hypothetical protein [Caulobacter radicis]